MRTRVGYFQSTIGRKQLVGVTGLGLSLFVLIHALGNFLIFVGPEAYNSYAHALTSNKLIFVAEFGLLALFFVHLGLATRLAVLNKKARSEGYAVSASGEKGTSPVKKSLWAQGVILLVFVVLHLKMFKFGLDYQVSYGNVIMRDLYSLVVEEFRDPITVAWYVGCMFILGMHLSHGVSSSLQTLGFNHPRHTARLKVFGYFFATFVATGFILQPLYVHFFK